eukprot:m.84863 g.84863  ORF g.84863 m.84863 type:complete len:454 (+) comp36416_c0_seq14:59-1420(+)
MDHDSVDLSLTLKIFSSIMDSLWRNGMLLWSILLVVTSYVAYFIIFTATKQFYALVAVLFVCYVLYYYTCIVHRPTLHASPLFKEFLLRRCPSVARTHFPTFLAFGGLMHSFLRSFRERPILRYEREILRLPEEGSLALDWSEGEVKDNKMILILPGLSGSSLEGYSKIFCKIATCNGYRAAIMNNRGCGDTTLTVNQCQIMQRGMHRTVSKQSARAYSAANTDDLRAVLTHITTKYPGISIFAMGVSLGGCLLTHYLGECGQSGEKPKVIAVFAISAPYDVEVCRRQLEKPHRLVTLNCHLAKNLTNIFKKNLEVYKAAEKNLPIDISKVLQAKTLRDFDTRYTVPMFGYSTWQEYYAAASTKSKLSYIQIPYLALNSDDDPFAPPSALPFEEFKSNSSLAMVETRVGGHIGFGIGLQPGSERLMDRIFSEYSQACFEHQEELKLLYKDVGN